MNKLYLGWDNKTRNAWGLRSHSVVVMTRGEESRVLQGDNASDFLARITELTHHQCGVAKSARMAKWLSTLGDRHTDPYNIIFDEYFEGV